jgi:hypothetical protein
MTVRLTFHVDGPKWAYRNATSRFSLQAAEGSHGGAIDRPAPGIPSATVGGPLPVDARIGCAGRVPRARESHWPGRLTARQDAASLEGKLILVQDHLTESSHAGRSVEYATGNAKTGGAS